MNRTYLIIKYIKQVLKLRSLLKKYNSKNISSLYWYDLNIKHLTSVLGILKVTFFILFNNEIDEIFKNYNLKNYYHGDPVGDGIYTSGATVWNCTALPNAKFLEGNNITKYLEQNADIIIKEFNNNLSHIINHPDNNTLTNKDGQWEAILLYKAGGIKDTNLKILFPKTFEIVEKLRLNTNFGLVFYSNIYPGTNILPHCGSSNLRHRYHLGVDIPEPDKCKIRVGTEWKNWMQGKSFGFDDSFEHEVVHNGTKNRTIFSIDIWNDSLSDDDVEFFENKIFKTFGKDNI